MSTTPVSATAAVVPAPLGELYRHIWLHAQGARAKFALALGMLGGSQLLKLGIPWMAAQAINGIQSAGRAGLGPAAVWIGAILAAYVGCWSLHGPCPGDGAHGGATGAPQRGRCAVRPAAARAAGLA